MISSAVGRALHRVALRPPYEIRPDVLEYHRSIPVVDLVVGTALFRRAFVARTSRGHVDLPRLRAAAIDVVGLTIATRFPNLQGTLSAPHFRSLGIPVRRATTNIQLLEAFVGRIREWQRTSGGELELSGADDLVQRSSWSAERVDARGSRPVRAFLGVQGAHVLDGDLSNVERLRSLGVRMLALAHVMDNEAVGSSTGARRGGLTPFGRELVRELERVDILVDLAHVSARGIRDTVEVLQRPFVVSHTGFTELAARPSRWRRYSAATRNLSREDAELVASAGGLIGVTLATQLLGGDDLAAVLDSFAYAAEVCGIERVALGSDFDGALKTVFDATGVPLITQGLLDRGFSKVDVARIMGGNALSVLGTSSRRKVNGSDR